MFLPLSTFQSPFYLYRLPSSLPSFHSSFPISSFYLHPPYSFSLSLSLSLSPSLSSFSLSLSLSFSLSLSLSSSLSHSLSLSLSFSLFFSLSLSLSLSSTVRIMLFLSTSKYLTHKLLVQWSIIFTTSPLMVGQHTSALLILKGWLSLSRRQ